MNQQFTSTSIMQDELPEELREYLFEEFENAANERSHLEQELEETKHELKYAREQIQRFVTDTYIGEGSFEYHAKCEEADSLRAMYDETKRTNHTLIQVIHSIIGKKQKIVNDVIQLYNNVVMEQPHYQFQEKYEDDQWGEEREQEEQEEQEQEEREPIRENYGNHIIEMEEEPMDHCTPIRQSNSDLYPIGYPPISNSEFYPIRGPIRDTNRNYEAEPEFHVEDDDLASFYGNNGSDFYKVAEFDRWCDTNNLV
jgi:hypothetical protein